MPDIKNLEAALGLSKDKSKLLNLTFGTSNITPGDYLPKRRKLSKSLLLRLRKIEWLII